jgi:hypothetical protein
MRRRSWTCDLADGCSISRICRAAQSAPQGDAIGTCWADFTSGAAICPPTPQSAQRREHSMPGSSCTVMSNSLWGSSCRRASYQTDTGAPAEHTALAVTDVYPNKAANMNPIGDPNLTLPRPTFVMVDVEAAGRGETECSQYNKSASGALRQTTSH